MAIINQGIKKSDARELPIDDMIALGDLLASFMKSKDTFEGAIDLCIAFYRSLGFYANGDLKVEFIPGVDAAGTLIEVKFSLPDWGWTYSRYTYAHRSLKSWAPGVSMLQDMKFILDGALQEAAERMFLSLESKLERSRIGSALTYALALE